MSNYVIEGLEQPLYEYLACYVTVINKSKHKLLNADIVTNWGKYTVRPATNIESWPKVGHRIAFTMMGRALATSGCEGSVTYSVGDVGLGSVKFSYACPYSGDNQAVPTNNSLDLKLEVYARISENYNWKADGSNWGKEGQVPIDGHPVSILFVVYDLHPSPDTATADPESEGPESA